MYDTPAITSGVYRILLTPLLSTLLILLAAALAMLTQIVLDPDADLLEPAGWPLKRAASVAGADQSA